MEHPPYPKFGIQLDNEEEFEWNGHRCMYLWYPQMGGYSGKAVAVFGEDQDDCVNVYVWHDGEFPFTEEVGPPKKIHHCLPEQFIRFGESLVRKQQALKPRTDEWN